MEMNYNSPTSICSSKKILGLLALTIKGQEKRKEWEGRRGGREKREGEKGGGAGS
jgi:hypothetical protein